MATKDEIVRTIERFQSDLEQTVSALPEGSWSNGVYESGWNVNQLLCHIASTSGVAGFVLNMAQAPAPAMPGGGAFNIDDFNKMQVEMRAGKSATELLSEIQGNFERDIGAVARSRRCADQQALQISVGHRGCCRRYDRQFVPRTPRDAPRRLEGCSRLEDQPLSDFSVVQSTLRFAIVDEPLGVAPFRD